MRVEEIAHDPLTNRVIRSIQDLILRGEVAPGEYLPSQQSLASQLGVGLSTVREAMKALSMIGLLEAHAGRGTRVMPDALKVLQSATAMKASLQQVEADAIWEARLVIEVALTRLAAQRATDEDIAEIEATLEEMRSNAADPAAFARADMRFHLAVARASKNDVLAQTYYVIHSLLEEAIRMADALPGGTARALANHAQILQGIKTRNPARAEQACERQITDVVAFQKAGLLNSDG